MDGPHLCHPNVIFTLGDKKKRTQVLRHSFPSSYQISPEKPQEVLRCFECAISGKLQNYCEMKIRECQIGMQGPKRSLAQSLVIFANYLDMATSRMAFLDLNLHVLQLSCPFKFKN